MTELSDIELYKLACYLRTTAERSSDPETYRLAADKFGQCGFITAQQSCLERARHYEHERVTA